MGTLFKKAARGGRDGTWYAEYTDYSGKRVQKSTRTRDKKTAKQILQHWENESAKRSTGFIDPTAERITLQSQRPLANHISEFIASIESAGRSSIHTERTKKRVMTIARLANWQIASDITPESVEKYAQGLREDGFSAQTIAHHMQAVKQLTRWMRRTNRLPNDPLDTVTKPNPQSDRRRERRMLLPTEWPYLRKNSPSVRAIIYELAIQTGLRSSEIRALKRANVHVSAKTPYVTVPSRDTKDARLARQYVTPSLAQRLRDINRKGLLFDLDEFGMADMLRDDLAVARDNWLKAGGGEESDFLEPVNDAGERLDFHALRHTCGAWLALKGVHPKTIQTIMRHKSITLTMDTYGHLFPEAEPEAISQLGELLNGQ